MQWPTRCSSICRSASASRVSRCQFRSCLFDVQIKETFSMCFEEDDHPEGFLCGKAASGASTVQSGAHTPRAKAALGHTHGCRVMTLPLRPTLFPRDMNHGADGVCPWDANSACRAGLDGTCRCTRGLVHRETRLRAACITARRRPRRCRNHPPTVKKGGHRPAAMCLIMPVSLPSRQSMVRPSS